MSKELEQEAKELVEGFSKILHENAGFDFIDESFISVSKQCAIKHCELSIDNLDKLTEATWGYHLLFINKDHYTKLIYLE